MQVGQVRVLNVRMLLLQVIPELHGNVGAVVTLGAVVHLDPFVFACVQNVLADVFSAVGPEGKNKPSEGTAAQEMAGQALG